MDKVNCPNPELKTEQVNICHSFHSTSFEAARHTWLLLCQEFSPLHSPLQEDIIGGAFLPRAEEAQENTTVAVVEVVAEEEAVAVAMEEEVAVAALKLRMELTLAILLAGTERPNGVS